MLTPRLAALLFLAIALILFAVALVPQPRLHAMLSARAGHEVSGGYVERVHARALACAIVAAVCAVGWWLAVRWWHFERVTALGMPSRVAWMLIAIGTVARAILLNGPPHYDEAFTITEFVRHSPLFFLTRYTHANNHVFHTLLVWLVPGEALWTTRLPAFLAGIGVLAATYFLARRWHGENAALVALALAAVASPLVEYSVQARGYTILTLAFLLLFLIDDDRLRAVLIALGAWTIPTMLYAAAAWALWMVVTQRAWRRVAFVAFAAGALTFLLYLPILVISGPASIASNGNTLSVPYAVLFEELPKTFVVMARDWSVGFTTPIAIVIALAAIVAMARRDAPALAATLIAVAVLLLVFRKVPFPRVWIFVLPLVLIAAAGLVTRIRVPAALIVIVTVVLAANAVRVTGRDTFVEDPAMRDAAALAKRIAELPPDARVLVTTPLDAPYAFYVPAKIVQDRFDSDPAAVRATMLAAPDRYAVLSDRDQSKFRELALPFIPVPVARFPHSTLVALRSAQ